MVTIDTSGCIEYAAPKQQDLHLAGSVRLAVLALQRVRLILVVVVSILLLPRVDGSVLDMPVNRNDVLAVVSSKFSP